MKHISVLVIGLAIGQLAVAQGKLIREGHRGCRGLMPENTIAAMEKAMDLGVQVLELDVVISQDRQVVVSHDLYMSSEISLKPSGDSVSADEQKSILLYNLPYAEIKKYDVGTKHNAQFPQQQNFRAYKPLLSELIDSVDRYAKIKGLPKPSFNVEIKSNPESDDLSHPKPQEFVDLVMNICTKGKILQRMNIQSFDPRPLQLIHQQFPKIKLAFLTANKKTVEDNCKDLGFIPDFYSPYYKTVDSAAVEFSHRHNIKIIPWTVNTKEEIGALVALGVDGIITDYPNLF